MTVPRSGTVTGGDGQNPQASAQGARQWFLRPTILDGLVVTLEAAAFSAVLGGWFPGADGP